MGSNNRKTGAKPPVAVAGKTGALSLFERLEMEGSATIPTKKKIELSLDVKVLDKFSLYEEYLKEMGMGEANRDFLFQFAINSSMTDHRAFQNWLSERDRKALEETSKVDLSGLDEEEANALKSLEPKGQGKAVTV